VPLTACPKVLSFSLFSNNIFLSSATANEILGVDSEPFRGQYASNS